MFNNRSKSTLFLIEQLIVVAIFAICAVACVRILTTAYFYARDTRDLSHAIIIAENAAESFKATSGDFERTASLIGGRVDNFGGYSAVVVYFDSSWHLVDDPAQRQAYYVLYLISTIREYDISRIQPSNLAVFRQTGEGDLLVSFDVAARRGELLR